MGFKIEIERGQTTVLSGDLNLNVVRSQRISRRIGFYLKN